MSALDPDPDPNPAFPPPPSISTSLLYTRGRHQPSHPPRPAPPPQPQPPLAPRLKHATLHPAAPLVTETSAAYFPEGLARFLMHGGQTHYVPRGWEIGEGEGEDDSDGDGDGEGTVYFDAQETLDRDGDDAGGGWMREDAGEAWGGEDTGEAYWGGEDRRNPRSWGARAAATGGEEGWEETVGSSSLDDDCYYHRFPRFEGRRWIGEDTRGEAWGRSELHNPHRWGASATATDGEEWAETIYSPSLDDDDDHHHFPRFDHHHHFPRLDIYRSHAVVPRLFETASDSDFETETGADGLY